MQRFPPLSIEQIKDRLDVDLSTGKCLWKDATKFHENLNGKEAGYKRMSRNGKSYWVIKINGIPYKRAQIVLTISTGFWPEEMVDHENGDSLDDKQDNLRHATGTQNAWNHRTRKKKSDLPMGIRLTKSGRYQARIACNKEKFSIGVFNTLDEATSAYLSKRREMFHAYCAL